MATPKHGPKCTKEKLFRNQHDKTNTQTGGIIFMRHFGYIGSPLLHCPSSPLHLSQFQLAAVINCGIWPDALFCTVKYCTAVQQYCTAVWCLLWYSNFLCCTLEFCNTLHYTTLLCTVLHCTTLHCTALYCTVLHYTALHWPRHRRVY